MLLERLTAEHVNWSAAMADLCAEFGLSGWSETRTTPEYLMNLIVDLERGIGRTLEAIASRSGSLDDKWNDELTMGLIAILPPLSRTLQLTRKRITAVGELPQSETDLLLRACLESALAASNAAQLIRSGDNGYVETGSTLVRDLSSGIVLKLSAILKQQEAMLVGRQLLAGVLESEERCQVPSLELRDKPVMNTWAYQNEIMTWDIFDGERVLDVGSGGWPFSKATHLADMYMGETTHRAEAMQRDERPVVCLDIHQMPFEEKTWDFIFCSHVLEHLDRPGDAIRELTRVARRGYIEVPTRLSDTMLNFTRLTNHHRWHGLILGETLVLMEWKDQERRDMGSDDFYRLLMSRYHNTFQKYFEDNWDMFYAMLPWRDEIPFVIIDKDGRVIDRHDGARDR